MDLATVWFLLLGVLLAGYAVLDGFDLGVGILHPLARTDEERRVYLDAIGPLWDGNEVWLVTFGGALFAMFPEAYATIFSAFYVPFMALLFALILRAVSIEFRGKRESRAWRGFWDTSFCSASGLATLVFGIGVGDAVRGIPLDGQGVFTGTLGGLLQPYAILVGLLAVALFAMHGAIFLFLKTEDAVQERLGPWLWHTWGVFLALYVLVTVYTLVDVPRTAEQLRLHPWAGLVVVLNVLAIANVPRAFTRKAWRQAFLSSCVTILCMVGLLGLALYPNLVTASNDASRSLTLHNAASSAETLTIGLVIVAVGMPFVLAYTAIVYWTFRGKVRPDEQAY